MNHTPRKIATAVLLTATVCLFPMKSLAQLSSNPDKFLGNITTRGQVDYGSEKFWQLWNQITPENETKWDACEPQRGNFTFGGADRSANYAKQHGFPFKFHTLIWGAQYPSWMNSLSTKEQYKALCEWFDAVQKHYPNLEIIDVVNEAIEGHQPAPYKAALGGNGKTGYDWIIKAFEMAYERMPNAILVYNDYNSFTWQKSQFIDLVRTLRDAGAPIDAYGCQSHDLTDISLSDFKSAMNEIQNALKIPMYSTEFDIGTSNDQKQLTQYQNLIPYMWEADYCAGITLWGYIYGATWTTDGNSGIIKDGKDRPAMTWLREYMQSDTAKTAKSPFPGMKKEASIYVKPLGLKVAKGDVMPIKVHARMATKTIEKVDLYVGSDLIATMTEAPYVTEYTVPENSSSGWKTLKAVVTTTDGTTYERLSRINVLALTTKREPYNETAFEVPGTIKIDEYDKGASGVSYSNTSRNITLSNKDNAWMEYTVDVKEDGIYSFDAEIAAIKTGGAFHLSEYSLDGIVFLSEVTNVPKTGSNTNFQTIHCVMQQPLTAGRHIICVNIDKGGFYFKSLTFQRYEQDKSISVSVSSIDPATIMIGDSTVININASSPNSTIANVKVFANDLLIGTLTEAPYSLEFKPNAKGSYVITAIATDAEGRENVSGKKTLKVTGKREPFSGTPIVIPGVIQAEDFDKGGEGFTFHDSDSNREGDVNYRSDSEGVDFVKGNNGTAIGYTAANEWLEYTINVTDPGKYSYEATVSSGTTNSAFTIALVESDGKFATLAKVNVPQTGNNNWDTYKVVKGSFAKKLPEGQQILRFTINGANCNIDKVELICTTSDGIEDVIANDNLSEGPTFNLSGQKVGNNYRGIIIRNGKKMIRR